MITITTAIGSFYCVKYVYIQFAVDFKRQQFCNFNRFALAKDTEMTETQVEKMADEMLKELNLYISIELTWVSALVGSDMKKNDIQ